MRNVSPASTTMWFSVAQVSLPSSTITVVSTVNAGPPAPCAGCDPALITADADANAVATIKAVTLVTVSSSRTALVDSDEKWRP
jgi:hypothetical protein